MEAKFLRVAMVAGLAISLVACGDDDESSADDPASTTTPADDGGEGEAPAEVGDPIRIGALLEMSGAAAPFGASSEAAIRLAIDRLNEAGGITVNGVSHEFEMVLVDNETDPAAAVAGAQQLVADEGVQFILGPVTSSLAPTVAQAVTPQGVIVISDAGSLHELIAGDAVETTGNLIFRSLYPADVQAAIAAESIQEVFPDVQRVAFVLPDDGSGRASSTTEVIQNVTDAGLEVVAEEYVPATATDFQTVLTGVRDADPDLIWVCCQPATVSGLMRQAAELGIDAPFMHYSGAPLSVALGDAIGEQVPFDAAVVYLPSVLERLPNGDVLTAKPGVAEFAAELEASGQEITAVSGLGLGFFYDAISLLAAAMEQAGTVDDTEAIAEALEEVTVEGVNGTIGFGRTHAWTPPADVCVARAGNPEPECIQVDAPN